MARYTVRCARCGHPVAEKGDTTSCPKCGGRLEIAYDPTARTLTRADLTRSSKSGVWKHSNLLPVESCDGEFPTLGEGNTGIHQCRRLAEQIGVAALYAKNEGLNPTGTFKDRAAVVALAKAREFGTRRVAIGSGGNAAASAAAYAALYGLPCFVFLPDTTPRERVAQSLMYGAAVIRVKGTINDAISLIDHTRQEFLWYNVTTASRLNPYQAEGVKTIAYELVQDLDWEVPDWLVTPVGGGGLLSSCWRGFLELKQLGLIDKLPHLVGVQPAGCAPLVKAYQEGRRAEDIAVWPNPPRSIAVTIADVFPLDGDLALNAIRESNGTAEAVTDEEIIAAAKLLGRTEGIFAEPAGAAPLAGIIRLKKKGVIKAQDKVAFVVTGNGLKDLATAAGAFADPPLVEDNDLRAAVSFWENK